MAVFARVLNNRIARVIAHRDVQELSLGDDWPR